MSQQPAIPDMPPSSRFYLLLICGALLGILFVLVLGLAGKDQAALVIGGIWTATCTLLGTIYRP